MLLNETKEFIQGSTAIASGLGFSTISLNQLESTKTEQSIETYVTLDQEKVSFYSDVIKEKNKNNSYCRYTSFYG